MSLLDLARKTKEGFNPEKDAINGGNKIPVGEYDAVIEKVEFRQSDSGWEQVAVTVAITIGEQQGRKEIVTFSFIEEWKGKAIPEFVLQKNMKMAQKLAYIGEYQWTEKDFLGTDTVAEALENIIGTQLIFTIKERKNTKDPSNPYREYEFDKYASDQQLPVEESKTIVDIPDEDLPF